MAKANVPNGMSTFFFFFFVFLLLFGFCYYTVTTRHASQEENTFNTIQRKLVYCFWRFSTHKNDISACTQNTESVLAFFLLYHINVEFIQCLFFGSVQIQGLSSTVACPMRFSYAEWIFFIQRKLSEIVIIEFNLKG